jgi:hypothetical protein
MNKVSHSFYSAMESELEKDAFPIGAYARTLGRAIKHPIFTTIGQAIKHPNLTIRASQAAGGLMNTLSRVRNVTKDNIVKEAPKILKSLSKTVEAGQDLYARAAGLPTKKTILEKGWGATKKVGKIGLDTGKGVAIAGVVGGGALAYGALNRPPTSDLNTLSGF